MSNSTVAINPEKTLIFKGKSPEEIDASIITLMNFGNKPVTYKLKTTHPLLFSVKPKVGIIFTNHLQSVNVSIRKGLVIPTNASFVILVHPIKENSKKSVETFWEAGKFSKALRMRKLDVEFHILAPKNQDASADRITPEGEQNQVVVDEVIDCRKVNVHLREILNDQKKTNTQTSIHNNSPVEELYTVHQENAEDDYSECSGESPVEMHFGMPMVEHSEDALLIEQNRSVDECYVAVSKNYRAEREKKMEKAIARLVK